MKYRFIADHSDRFSTRIMCRLLSASKSGYYNWRFRPLSDRAVEDRRLLPLIRASHAASHCVYGYRRILLDLREMGEPCGKHRVARIMKSNDIRAIHGYKRPRVIYGRPAILTPNTLDRRFTVPHPDVAWVTDITYIRTWQGWLYLAVVLDLYSRKVVGWSMKPSRARRLGSAPRPPTVSNRIPSRPKKGGHHVARVGRIRWRGSSTRRSFRWSGPHPVCARSP